MEEKQVNQNEAKNEGAKGAETDQNKDAARQDVEGVPTLEFHAFGTRRVVIEAVQAARILQEPTIMSIEEFDGQRAPKRRIVQVPLVDNEKKFREFLSFSPWFAGPMLAMLFILDNFAFRIPGLGTSVVIFIFVWMAVRSWKTEYKGKIGDVLNSMPRAYLSYVYHNNYRQCFDSSGMPIEQVPMEAMYIMSCYGIVHAYPIPHVVPKEKDCEKCKGTGTIIGTCAACKGIKAGKEICIHCNGTGKIEARCGKCQGTGKIELVGIVDKKTPGLVKIVERESADREYPNYMNVSELIESVAKYAKVDMSKVHAYHVKCDRQAHFIQFDGRDDPVTTFHEAIWNCPENWKNTHSWQSRVVFGAGFHYNHAQVDSIELDYAEFTVLKDVPIFNVSSSAYQREQRSQQMALTNDQQIALVLDTFGYFYTKADLRSRTTNDKLISARALINGLRGSNISKRIDAIILQNEAENAADSEENTGEEPAQDVRRHNYSWICILLGIVIVIILLVK